MKRQVRAMRGGGRLRAVLLVLVIGVLVLSGCGTQKAGAAAVAGDERLTEAQLADLFDELDGLFDASQDGQRLPDDQLTLSILSLWVNQQLIGAIAEEEELSVTEAEIDAALPADQAERDAISRENAIPPSQLESLAELSLLFSAFSETQAEPGATPEETQAVLFERLQATADALQISVSPRFGTWNPETLAVDPRNPDRLSSPADGVVEPPSLDVPGQG